MLFCLQTMLVGSVVADVIIAIVMTIIVSLSISFETLSIVSLLQSSSQITRARAGTTFKATNDLLSKLLRQTIETGTVTAIVATIDLFLFAFIVQTNLHDTPLVNFCHAVEIE